MHRLGLTGGIGSGKSTVAGLLRRDGLVVIDADAISREVTAAGGPAIPAIAERLGPQFIAAGGALDRDRMREASYADANMRRRLEAIVHPLVGDEARRQEAAAIESGCRCIVFDVPLLVESRHWRQRVNQVLVVDCMAEVQIRRVMARNGLARLAVERIIASQATREARLRAADIVLFNGDDSMDRLASEVEQVAHGFGL